MNNNLQQQQPYYYGAVGERGGPGLDPRLYNLMPQQPWAPAPAPQSQPALKGRPVVSIEEARAAQIDLDGSLYVFPDLTNKKIYTKSINVDGTATFNVYALDESSQAASASTYVTHAELEEVLKKITSSHAPAAAAPKFNL